MDERTERTTEEWAAVSGWHRFGPELFVDRFKSRGWTVTVMGYRTPFVFKTKRAAVEQADVQVRELARRTR
jgi:hypothetical protein